jgi:hypothetical protein
MGKKIKLSDSEKMVMGRIAEEPYAWVGIYDDIKEFRLYCKKEKKMKEFDESVLGLYRKKLKSLKKKGLVEKVEFVDDSGRRTHTCELTKLANSMGYFTKDPFTSESRRSYKSTCLSDFVG